jgi:hypothetical protein
MGNIPIVAAVETDCGVVVVERMLDRTKIRISVVQLLIRASL